MATSTLSHHAIDGALGEILVDVRAGSRRVPQPAVLLVHGFKGFKDYAFLPVFAEQLARAGFVAITASVSGAGVDADGEFTRPDRFRRNTYTRELDDLHRVVGAVGRGELDVAPPMALGVVGHSRGGGMAILLASECPEVGAVVTWSAIGRARRHSEAQLTAWREAGSIEVPHARLGIRLPLDYEVAADCLAHESGRLDIAGAASMLGRPWLQVHGTLDETVPFEEAEALGRAGDASHHAFLAIEGAGHTYGAAHPWAGSTPALDQLFGATRSFLGSHLAP
ncbi:MAG TPA: dienelactone hydrolase family protein [Gemmatimonadales bacterium]|nr:dienelactone hydrolase family protein [Gemmatimonadales bacterium]